jgi:ABC-2 type transport system ATP-binding protein
VLLPTAGDVTVDGIDIARDPHAVRRRIGFLPDTPPLYNDMTVGRYLKFAAELRGVPSSEADKAVDRGRGEDGHARRSRPANLQPVARVPAARRRRAGAGPQARSC